MNARDTILGRIEAALRDVPTKGTDAPSAHAFRLRIDAGPETLVAEFAERARGYKVRVEQASRVAAPALAARLLAEAGRARLVVPIGFPGDLLPPGVTAVRDDGLDNATIAACDGVLTTCACAIAQTGTLVLDHGAGQGRRVLTLLPDYHLCFVAAHQIVGLVPEAVAAMAPAVRAGRPLTFMSGPSATSDIELSRVEGVHGPRSVTVIILAPDGGPLP